MAMALVNADPAADRPTTPEEFNKARERIADIVCRQLGNTRNVALTTYIDPLAFDRWADGTNWAEIAPGKKLTHPDDAAGTPTWMVKEGVATP
jgi:hypothetical protein